MDIKKCVDSDNAGWSSIEFGSNQDEEICWTVSSQQGSAWSNEDRFTDLFKKNWDKGSATWSDSSKQSSSWKTVCGTNPSWVITTESGSKNEYLGTCEWSTGKTELFIKKEVEEADSDEKKIVKLFICQEECLTEQTTGNTKQLGIPEKGNWLPITFKSKNTLLNKEVSP